MDALKTGYGLFRTFMPVLYCGGLLFYFFGIGGPIFGIGGSVEIANMLGLGPTLAVIAVVGLLFCLPLGLKIWGILRSPPGSGSGPRAPTPDDKDGFDPDAAIARYMASKRSAEPIPARPAPSYSAAPPAYKGGGPARPTGFGRRTS